MSETCHYLTLCVRILSFEGTSERNFCGVKSTKCNKRVNAYFGHFLCELVKILEREFAEFVTSIVK